MEVFVLNKISVCVDITRVIGVYSTKQKTIDAVILYYRENEDLEDEDEINKIRTQLINANEFYEHEDNYWVISKMTIQ